MLSYLKCIFDILKILKIETKSLRVHLHMYMCTKYFHEKTSCLFYMDHRKG
jgi:hypothetical protein